MKAEKLRKTETLERFLRSYPDKTWYLRQGTRSINGVKHCRIQGYYIPAERVAEALLDVYGSWPKLSELSSALKNEVFYDAAKKEWVEFTKSNLETARNALSSRIRLSLIQQDIKDNFDPLDLNVPPEILALAVGMFAADGLFVAANCVARISMTRPFFEDLFKSIAAYSNGHFHVVEQRPTSGQSTKRKVEIELVPASKDGSCDHIKLAAWLSCCFGPSVRKSKGFSPYPKEIANWPSSLKRVYALGYFIGDGSITIGKVAAGRRKPTAGVNLFCIPKVIPADYHSSVETFIRQSLDETFSIKKNNHQNQSTLVPTLE